jgi:benzodiazapine receptor
MRRADALGFTVAFLLCFGVAGIGAAVTAPAIHGWYAHLLRPAWTPPNAIFGPVWTMLYAMMAVAAGLVWLRRAQRAAITGLVLFLVQLALNLGWTLLFFGAHRPDLAAGEILVLDLCLVATLVVFARVSMTGALLLIPYLAWNCFASALSWEIWRLNSK